MKKMVNAYRTKATTEADLESRAFKDENLERITLKPAESATKWEKPVLPVNEETSNNGAHEAKSGLREQ